MNILLSNTCNRRCPYCFASERVSYTVDKEQAARPAPPFISRDDYEAALDFVIKNNVQDVGILGGEPSYHPDFVELLQMAWRRELRLRVFTNGLWRKRDVDTIAALDHEEHKRRLNIILNVNHPEISNPGEQKAQTTFLQKLGRYTALSFNIYRLDLDPCFLVDLIVESDSKRHIRLGIAEPLAQLESEFIEVRDYHKLAPKLMELARRCDEADITLGFDCGFTLCMFSAEEIGELFLSGAHFKSSCGPAIDVGTDLSVWSCFPLSAFSSGVYLKDFSNVDELVKHFREKFKRLHRTGVLPECIDCKQIRRENCVGGCAAHVFRELNPCV